MDYTPIVAALFFVSAVVATPGALSLRLMPLPRFSTCLVDEDR